MDNFNDLSQLFDMQEAVHIKRATCGRCGRPSPTCWCPSLPRVPVDIATKVIILQHPFEEHRKLQTARMLQLAAAPGRVEIWRGRHFASHKRRRELDSPGCAVLYPSSDSVLAESLPRGSVTTLVVLDGTWQQASGLHFHNDFLHKLPHIRVAAPNTPSAYVIRTQPDVGCLCTAEAAALAVDALEHRSDCLPAVLGPIEALCRHQLAWGAVPHADKRTKKRLEAEAAVLAAAAEEDNQTGAGL
ncbi:hypothetical protein BOX15_Mlig013836g1 [Macrostomum lignano]|uniref:tRNA-uridine aminocarboxypropyltransferase n=2 Tax=Macrostomum lignano TaxID=282301 RepID=A0A267EMQ7_9PLAT|nr:hypothetical protein BOX15_Mlig013836g4 [Macrostomum lignano]PAA62605.1 hypothetical protein BOX15_Mlig006557g1 [Macrostomum lignano]PAA62835.1 hypothetical protein BOX15_Mlig013836g2 [Macrostomum lignano]PAA62836.1 hypothetical protein BOX15_Mlig013836g1 [Macrostomum lignano]